MRIANVAGRAKLITGLPGTSLAVDVAEASGGRFGPSPRAVYDNWSGFRDWASVWMATGAGGSGLPLSESGARAVAFSPTAAGPPSPEPRQVFAVALNYVDHAAESGNAVPAEPLIFTKYVSAFSGPVSSVHLPEGGHTDWECELVAVIGLQARDVEETDAWSYVAGVTVGQDLSERVLQRKGPVPQFSLGKSHAGFAPSGPFLVTVDELDDPDDLAIGCEVNGEVMQSARTSDMIFTVPVLVSYLSRVVTLEPGDVIFTGTPPGVGMGRSPQVFLRAGDRLTSHIEGIGDLEQTFT